jgi:putative spermidine/putrescine transport system permease protein
MFDGSASDTQVTHLQRLWLYIFSLVILLFLVGPSVVVVLASFSNQSILSFPPQEWGVRWYGSYFTSTEWLDATFISLTAAALTTVIATPLGTCAAYSIHMSRSRIAGVIRMALMAPMIVPAILIAIGVFFVYARMGLNNTLAGLVLAHVTLAIPFVVITVEAGLKSYDLNQELVARSLGASRIKAFFKVTLPQIRFSIISGALFAIVTSLDEVVIALFVSGGENATVPRRMFTALKTELDPTIASISSLLIGVSAILLICGLVFGREGKGKTLIGAPVTARDDGNPLKTSSTP